MNSYITNYVTCSIWGCGPGRPFDNCYVLRKVLKENNYIKMFFDEEEECVIYSPSEIIKKYSSEISKEYHRIIVKEAQRITWRSYYYGRPKTMESLIEEEYIRTNSRMVHKISKGPSPFNYITDIKTSENAFEMSANFEIENMF